MSIIMTSVPNKMNNGNSKIDREMSILVSETENHLEDPQMLQNKTIHSRDDVTPFWKMFLDNRLYVVTYCCVFASFGVCVGFLGPTVFDLGCQTNSDLKKMNWVFFVQLVMTLVGSISAGCMATRVPVHSLMLCGAVGVAFSMFLIPICENLSSLIFVLIVMGWCMGCIDCLANLKIIQMFGKNVGPFLQAMHCSYGVGAFVSPMIASAFLLNQDCTPYIDGFTVDTPFRLPADLSKTRVQPFTVTIQPQPQRVFRYHNMSKLPNAFYILGGLQLVIAGLVAYVICQEKLGKLKPRVVSTDYHQDNSKVMSQSDRFTGDSKLVVWFTETCCSCGPREVFMVTLITCLSLFVFDGLQSSFANYIYTYAHESGVDGLKKYEGAILDACFWGLFAAGRLIAVPVASRLTASFMLVINVAGCSLALLITIIFRWSHITIYVGTCCVGLFVSSMSPTVMSMAEQFVDINPSITTFMVVFAALGEALCPVIVGNLVVSFGPTSFLVFCFTFSLSAIFLYVAMLMVGRHTDKTRAARADSFFWFSGKHMVMDGENTLIKPNSIKYYNRMCESDSEIEVDPTELQDNTFTK